MKLNIPYLLQIMTVEEKAGLCSGADFWHTKAVERLGLPAIMVSDGPHGLRKQDQSADHIGINESIKTVCFPAGSALASSFDRALIGKLGSHLGEEARAEQVHTVLGPAINIKRSPLCGRNFEYLSEDPYLAGEMSASYVNALQEKNVGVSVKHYAANNQEYRRMSTDTIVSMRALREIYLAAFEKTVRNAKPWTLMCAYNRLNGTYCCEHDWLLSQVLRDDWGFEGIVMTDWGAMNDRVKALKAGLELEMPSSHGYNDRKIVAAVQDGSLSMADLDKAVERLLRWTDKGLADEPAIDSYDKDAHHAFARRAAAECAVLLKNEGGLLPLAKSDEVVFIGSFAAAPRFQGGGSSHINSYRVTSAVDAAKGIPGVKYCPGWAADGETPDAKLLAEAVDAAKNAKVAVVFAGLPDSYESEGYDRTHLNMPACQNELIAAVCAAQPNTAVVLHAGSPIVMPWLDKAAAVLDMYLGGQAVGAAAVDLLFGDAAPAGRLAETFPLCLEDTPSYLNFPGTGKKVVYAEDVYVGYRWYDSRGMAVLFPFGYGLAYTTFDIRNLTVSAKEYGGQGTLDVSAEVVNTGARTGKQVVQLYVAPPKNATQPRPAHELKGFAKVELAPGEAKAVTFTLDARSFAYWEESINNWHIEAGAYTIEVGANSRDLPLTEEILLNTNPLPFVFEDSTVVGDLMAAGKSEAVAPLFEKLKAGLGAGSSASQPAEAAVNGAMLEAMVGGMPVHSLASFAEMPDGFMETIKKAL